MLVAVQVGETAGSESSLLLLHTVGVFVLTVSVGPKTYHKWDLLMQPYPVGMGCTEEEATRVMQNERDNLDLVESIVRKEGLDVDFWRGELIESCLLYTSPSPRDGLLSRMPSSA